MDPRADRERVILHLDMDAFFASVEQKAHPHLRGRPVLVGGRGDPTRSVVCAASYEAKAFGVANGMPAWRARRLCPRAVFLPADIPKYMDVSDRIARILHDFTPEVERLSIDEFHLDLTGLHRIFPSVSRVARAIKARIRAECGLTCSIGGAPTRITAKLLAERAKPDGCLIMDRMSLQALLRTTPVEDLCGVGPALRRRLHFFGVLTCGRLAEYPTDLLREHFGEVGLRLRAACRLEEVPRRGAAFSEGRKSFGHFQTLPGLTEDPLCVRIWIRFLAETTALRLRRAGLRARTVALSLGRGFGDNRSRRRTSPAATCDGREIYDRCLRMVGEPPPLPLIPVRALGVIVSGLSPEGVSDLFEDPGRRERLLEAVDRINDRFGGWTIASADYLHVGGGRR